MLNVPVAGCSSVQGLCVMLVFHSVATLELHYTNNTFTLW